MSRNNRLTLFGSKSKSKKVSWKTHWMRLYYHRIRWNVGYKLYSPKSKTVISTQHISRLDVRRSKLKIIIPRAVKSGTQPSSLTYQHSPVRCYFLAEKDHVLQPLFNFPTKNGWGYQSISQQANSIGILEKKMAFFLPILAEESKLERKLVLLGRNSIDLTDFAESLHLIVLEANENQPIE